MVERRRFDRRSLLQAGATCAAGTLVSRAWAGSAPDPGAEFAALERRASGRLGVAVLDSGTGALTGYRLDERFSMCSTFKLLLVAAVLERCDRGQEQLTRQVAVPAKPLLGNSPATGEHAGATMAVGAVCQAVITLSDNTGANLLLATIGGPAGYTAFARSLGDPVTRLDRTEPTLNEAKPGDPRDTASPAATARNLRNLLLGKALKPISRELLTGWMVACTTGLTCLRAGLPAGWKVGDKTGSDGVMTRNDIAIVGPDGRAPVLVAAYLTECQGTDEKRNAVLAEVGRLVAKRFQGAGR